ncbi:MAG TPA: winged helix-turn-helix domain-containing protein [Steroidobacteraceae bacterium]
MDRTPIDTFVPKIIEAAKSSATAATASAYKVGDLQIDVTRRRVLRSNTELLAAGLSFDLFLVLVRAASEVVSIDELMRQVWPGLIVGPEAVTQRIKILRRALGDDADRPRYIAGVRGRGYRLVAPAVTAESESSSSVPGSTGPTARRIPRQWYLTALLCLAVLAVAIPGYYWHRDVSGSRAQALAQKTNPGVVEPRTAVAVLPFVNLTGDPTKDYLGEGMAEQVINMLARVPGLKVPARTSSFAYQGRNIDVRRIAADLGVGTILEGSVREAGARVRITAELINAQDGLHLWSQSYDRSFTDLFQLQDDLAAAIVKALEARIGTASSAAIAPISRTGNIEAYDFYLQGEAALARPTPQGFQRAVEYLRAAVARDSALAPAYARMGTALVLSGESGIQPIENVAAAERVARRAYLLDPTLAESQDVLSNVSRLRGHWLEAEDYGRRAVSLSPDDANTHLVEGYLLDEVGQLRASLAEYDQAYRLAPANLAVIMLRSFSQSLLGRDADALKSMRLAEDLGLPHTSFDTVYEQAAFRSGRFAEAASAAADFLNGADPDEARTREIVLRVYGALADPGSKPAAMAAAARLYPPTRARHLDSEKIANATPCLQSSYAIALLGELDVAYDMAGRCLDALAAGAINHRNQRLWSDSMRPFRQDPRFQAFAARLGLVQYWRQYGPPDECRWEAGRLKCL